MKTCLLYNFTETHTVSLITEHLDTADHITIHGALLQLIYLAVSLVIPGEYYCR